MAGLWVLTVAALLLALIALGYARRTARQLAHVTEMYWQLKFDFGELRAKVDPPAPPAPAEPTATFVPLTRLRQGSGEAGSA